MRQLSDLLGLRQRRQAKVNKEGSPFFRYVPGIIAAAGDDYIWIGTQFPAAAKYGTLDWYEIVNNSAVNLTITINGVQTHLVPAGTARKDDNTAIHSFNIHDDSLITATAVGEVVVTFQRQPMTEDRAIRGAL